VILVGSPGSSDEHGETKARLRTMIALSQNAPANGMGAAGKGSVEVRPSRAHPLMNMETKSKNTLAFGRGVFDFFAAAPGHRGCPHRSSTIKGRSAQEKCRVKH
jgi:hypothetical protein